jgi:hypothetical protein
MSLAVMIAVRPFRAECRQAAAVQHQQKKVVQFIGAESFKNIGDKNDR